MQRPCAQNKTKQMHLGYKLILSPRCIKTHLYRSRRPRASFRNSVYQQVCAQAGSGMNVSRTNSFKPKFVSEFTVCKTITWLNRAYRIKYITFKCKWRKFTDTQTKHFTDSGSRSLKCKNRTSSLDVIPIISQPELFQCSCL